MRELLYVYFVELCWKETGESLSQTHEIGMIIKEQRKKKVTKKAEETLKKGKIIGIRKEGMYLKIAKKKKAADWGRFNIYKSKGKINLEGNYT